MLKVFICLFLMPAKPQDLPPQNDGQEERGCNGDDQPAPIIYQPSHPSKQQVAYGPVQTHNNASKRPVLNIEPLHTCQQTSNNLNEIQSGHTQHLVQQDAPALWGLYSLSTMEIMLIPVMAKPVRKRMTMNIMQEVERALITEKSMVKWQDTISKGLRPNL